MARIIENTVKFSGFLNAFLVVYAVVQVHCASTNPKYSPLDKSG